VYNNLGEITLDLHHFISRLIYSRTVTAGTSGDDYVPNILEGYVHGDLGNDDLMVVAYPLNDNEMPHRIKPVLSRQTSGGKYNYSLDVEWSPVSFGAAFPNGDTRFLIFVWR
jgi:hypothetical protein